MDYTITDRLRHAWDAFKGGQHEPDTVPYSDLGISYGYRPDRSRLNLAGERSIISSIYTRIGMDVASIDIKHVRVDENDRFTEEIDSGLNYCLTVEANLDQGARALRQDIVMTLLDKGVAAIVPVDTTLNPNVTGGYDILTLRVGEITMWYPSHVRVRVYNERTGHKEEIVLPKKLVAIIENPLYSVMNEPNSTLQRLIHKLSLLDSADEHISSGKLDIIMQLPYVIKNEARREQAEKRRKDIEFQLKGSKYGIAYTDGTERITQLNRPAENTLLKQVEFLTNLLYTQLGLTPGVFDGTADPQQMLNYNNRTIEPILGAIKEAMHRTFLTKTARKQGQAIAYFQDPFKLVPVNEFAELADKFTRNEILSTNEIRSLVGFRPSTDPKADELRNKNLPMMKDEVEKPTLEEGNQNET